MILKRFWVHGGGVIFTQTWPGYSSLTPCSGHPGAQRPIDGLMTPRVFRSVFARQKKRPRHCWRGLLDWVQKIAPFSVASIADSKNPILMQLKIGLVQLEIELVYHCRRRKRLWLPFFDIRASRCRACRSQDYRLFPATCLADSGGHDEKTALAAIP